MTDPAAEVIADELLYLTGRAIALGDFDMFKVHFMLPQILESLDGEEIMQTEHDLRRRFDAVQAHIKENDVADLVRSIVSSEFIDADTIGSTHVSKALKEDGTPVGPPFPTYSVIRRTRDGWKILRTHVVLLKNSIHEGYLASPPNGHDQAP